MILVGNSFA